MKIAGLIKRLEPLVLKLAGRLPLCPWTSVYFSLDPRTVGVHQPAMKIEVVDEEGALKKLRFDGRHESWFPASTRVNLELWHEYLAVFWSHPANTHYYLAGGTVIKPGDVCIDCGCCEGFFVFQALEAGAAKVIGIEPNPEMVYCLEKTFAKEIEAGRVLIQSAALGAYRGQTSFSFDAGCPAAGHVGGPTTGQSVAVETLAAVCEKLQLDRVDFVKMDIEGAEIQAVEGALPVLTKLHPKLAITTYHRQFDYMALRAMVIGSGYKHIKPVGVTMFTTEAGQTYSPALLHACYR